MDHKRFDESLKVLAGATGRRDAVRALGAIGTALLAALGLAHGSSAANLHAHDGNGGGHTRENRSKDRRQNRDRDRSGNRNRHRGHGGQQGPEEPAEGETPRGAAGGNGPDGPDGSVQGEGTRKTKRGPTGPAGPAGSWPAMWLVRSELSAPLSVTAGAAVVASAECGGAGKAVACGHELSATPAQLVNTVVYTVAPDFDRRDCLAQLHRTAEVGSTAGAQIRSIATRLD